MNCIRIYESPFGRLSLESDGVWLVGVRFWVAGHHEEERRPNDALLLDAERQLAEYFGGWRQSFDLPLKPQGTAFQQTVWAALRQIPFGQTITYKELAERIGNGKAVRAVGLANGRNPLPILIPCHRVIGSDGSLTGFGGGIEWKRQLLEVEGIRPPASGDLFPESGGR